MRVRYHPITWLSAAIVLDGMFGCTICGRAELESYFVLPSAKSPVTAEASELSGIR